MRTREKIGRLEEDAERRLGRHHRNFNIDQSRQRARRNLLNKQTDFLEYNLAH